MDALFPCHTCGQKFPRTAEFYPVARRTKSGLRNDCRGCARRKNNAYQQRTRAQQTKAQLRWRAAHPDASSASWTTWEKAHPERAKVCQWAGKKVDAALVRGTLTKPTQCTTCGASGRLEAAHHDYARPLAVTWLCHACHLKWDLANPKTVGMDLATILKPKTDAWTALKTLLHEGQTVHTRTSRVTWNRSAISFFLVHDTARTNITDLCCRAFDKPMTDDGQLLFSSTAAKFVKCLSLTLFARPDALYHVELAD